MADLDLFPVALALVDDALPAEQAVRYLVAQADGSVERVLQAEQRAEALVGALPRDERAQRLLGLLRDAARLAVKTPSTTRRPALSERLADATGSPVPATVDVVQLEADLARLRAHA